MAIILKNNLIVNIINKNVLSRKNQISGNNIITILSLNTSRKSIETIITSKLKDSLKLREELNVRPMSSIIDKTRAVISTDNHQNDCSRRKSISVLGGGAWGTAIADLIGHNVTLNKHLFHEEVIFYVRDEHLRLIIEKTRQNIRYLSAIKLPPNVKPVTSLSDAVTNCDIIIFVIPHQYIHSLCLQINDSIVSTRNPIGISLIKGIHVDNVNNLELTSQIINRMLGIEVGVLSGANIAIEVAQRQYSEATIVNPVTDNNNWEPILRSLFECNHFKVSFCKDGPTVEICGALKNVVAIGCGLSDGLGFGMNTKAAVLSCGLKEMIKFVQLFHPNYQLSTFFENCGIADTIASSFGGRNRRVSEALINSNKSIDLLERQLLGGQKLQGPHTAHVVHKLLEHKNLSKDFPFFTSIYRICNRSMNPKDFINSIQTRH